MHVNDSTCDYATNTRPWSWLLPLPAHICPETTNLRLTRHATATPALVLALLGEAVLVEEGHLRDRTEIVRH